MKIRFFIITLSFVFASMASATVYQAGGTGNVTFTGSQDTSGTGFGTLTNLLVLHNNGSETGSVVWNGSAVATTVDATNASDAYSFAQLINLGFSNTNLPGIAYNVNQQGVAPDTTLTSQGFQLQIFKPDGTLVAWTDTITAGTYTAGGGGSQQGQGSAAYLFTLDSAAQTLLAGYFINHPDYYLGAWGSIGQSNDGADGFYLVNTTTAPVPEPGTLLLLGGGFLVLGFSVRKRMKK